MSKVNASIQILPQELIEHILILLSEKDIIRYCSTYKAAQSICHSDGFWLNKLDHDYVVRTIWDHKVVERPFKYVIEYAFEENRYLTYQRWKRFFIPIETDDNILDIIHFMINAYKNNMYLVISNAIETHNIKILNYLIEYNIIPSIAKVVCGISHAISNAPRIVALNTLQWFEQYNIYPTQRDADYLAQFGRLDILEWLQQHGILPTQKGANRCIRGGYINILLWLSTHGILPTQEGANFAAEANNFYALQILYDWGILPTKEGFEYAFVNGHYNVLSWLIEHDMRVSNADIIKLRRALTVQNEFNLKNGVHWLYSRLDKLGGRDL